MDCGLRIADCGMPRRGIGCLGRRRPTGFNFTEVLFAVMILGIGFIMVAAIFPVALSQVKSNNEESGAARVARSVLPVLEELGRMEPIEYPADDTTMPILPATNNIVVPLPQVAMESVTGNQIITSDNRNAWV